MIHPTLNHPQTRTVIETGLFSKVYTSEGGTGWDKQQSDTAHQ